MSTPDDTANSLLKVISGVLIFVLTIGAGAVCAAFFSTPSDATKALAQLDSLDRVFALSPQFERVGSDSAWSEVAVAAAADRVAERSVRSRQARFFDGSSSITIALEKIPVLRMRGPVVPIPSEDTMITVQLDAAPQLWAIDYEAATTPQVLKPPPQLEDAGAGQWSGGLEFRKPTNLEELIEAWDWLHDGPEVAIPMNVRSRVVFGNDLRRWVDGLPKEPAEWHFAEEMLSPAHSARPVLRRIPASTQPFVDKYFEPGRYRYVAVLQTSLVGPENTAQIGGLDMTLASIPGTAIVPVETSTKRTKGALLDLIENAGRPDGWRVGHFESVFPELRSLGMNAPNDTIEFGKLRQLLSSQQQGAGTFNLWGTPIPPHAIAPSANLVTLFVYLWAMVQSLNLKRHLVTMGHTGPIGARVPMLASPATRTLAMILLLAAPPSLALILAGLQLLKLSAGFPTVTLLSTMAVLLVGCLGARAMWRGPSVTWT